VVAQSGGWWSLAVASLMMFALPSLLLARATEYSPETNVTVIFALVPVVVVVVWAATLSNQRGIALLLPALVGAAGVLFVLPFEAPASARGWESLAETILATILVAWACVAMHRQLRQRSCAGALIVGGSVNAIVLLAWSVLRGQPWSGWNLQAVVATGISAIVFALTVWLVAAIAPVRFAAKFMLVPLLTILEGVVLLRPDFTARLVAGVVLLLGGTAWLLSSGEAVDEEVLSLR
jgi:drug/metabolite transporter (DMT)-like permease